MKLTTKGQVTIPLNIRERLGLLPWTEVVFDVVDDSWAFEEATDGGEGCVGEFEAGHSAFAHERAHES